MAIQTRILIADGDDAVRKFLAAVLSQAGYVVDLCKNQSDALRKFDPSIHKALILDEEISDPASSGFRELQVPILLLFNGPAASEEIQGTMSIERLIKPFDPAELIAAIRRLLSA